MPLHCSVFQKEGQKNLLDHMIWWQIRSLGCGTLCISGRNTSAQIFLNWSKNVHYFKVNCTGKVCFPKKSKTYTSKVTAIFFYMCWLESIIFNVRSQTVYIKLSCTGACTALAEILPVFAETIEGFSTNASVECGGIRPLLLPVPTKYSVCISYKVTNISNSKKALKVSSVLVCILFGFCFPPTLPLPSFLLHVSAKTEQEKGEKWSKTGT